MIGLIPISPETLEDLYEYFQGKELDIYTICDFAAWTYYRKSMNAKDPIKSLEFLVYAEYYQEKADEIYKEN